MALPKIDRDSCGENFGQSQVMVYVDMNDAETIGELTEEAVKAIATWTGKMAGTAPKATLSPMLYNPAVNAGGERTWGGGNATPDGKVFNLGKEPSEFTAELRKATAAQQKSMEELTCMAEADRLGCYLFDGEGQVMGTVKNGEFAPIKVKKFYISDVTLMGKEEPDYNSLSMQFEEGWSADRKVVGLEGWRGADLISATVSNS